MFRLFPILFLISAAPAAAGTFICEDAEREVLLAFVRTYDTASSAYVIPHAQFKIAGDIGYTSADDPSNGGTVTLVNLVFDRDSMDFDFHLVAPDIPYDDDIASVRIAMLDEGNESAVGGVISIKGGGAWALVCSETADDA